MCKFIVFLYDMIPIQGIRAFLIKKHIDRCPVCQREMAIETLLEEKFKIPEWIESEQSLWPQIREKAFSQKPVLLSGRQKERPFKISGWQWALAGLALLVVVGINVLIGPDLSPRRHSREFIVSAAQPKIIITHAEIEGREAKPFVYETRERCFIWFEEQESKDN